MLMEKMKWIWDRMNVGIDMDWIIFDLVVLSFIVLVFMHVCMIALVAEVF